MALVRNTLVSGSIASREELSQLAPFLLENYGDAGWDVGLRGLAFIAHRFRPTLFTICWSVSSDQFTS